jgi:hypothetical protein
MMEKHPMQLVSIWSKAAQILAAATLAVALSAGTGLAATDQAAQQFVGTWKTQDTQGKAMEITLSEDGVAKGQREGEGLTGKWKAGKNAATITWDSGWTTKIRKKGDKYQKLAYEAGKPVKGSKPVHRSDAEKVQQP